MPRPISIPTEALRILMFLHAYHGASSFSIGCWLSAMLCRACNRASNEFAELKSPVEDGGLEEDVSAGSLIVHVEESF